MSALVRLKFQLNASVHNHCRCGHRSTRLSPLGASERDVQEGGRAADHSHGSDSSYLVIKNFRRRLSQPEEVYLLTGVRSCWLTLKSRCYYGLSKRRVFVDLYTMPKNNAPKLDLMKGAPLTSQWWEGSFWYQTGAQQLQIVVHMVLRTVIPINWVSSQKENDPAQTQRRHKFLMAWWLAIYLPIS